MVLVKKVWKSVFIFLIAAFVSDALPLSDLELNITQVIAKYNYPVQTHEVTTEDGYILKLIRVLPHPNNTLSTSTNKRRPVLLMHGLFSSAESWMFVGPNKSLSYFLSDNNYDVWLGNARGNLHSRNHIRYRPDSNFEFWDFTWNEIGMYDLPASIDYILKTTNFDKINFVGHSQGATCFFVMASERPEYNQKISLAITLAPAVYLNHTTNRLARMLAPFHKNIERMLLSLKEYELVPFLRNEQVRGVTKQLCHESSVFKNICKDLLIFISDSDPNHIDDIDVDYILSTIPGGSSVKQLAHYAQSIVSGDFKKYDYGTDTLNLQAYNSTQPPEYHLNNVIAPIAILYANQDQFVKEVDIKRLVKNLPNVIKVEKVPDETFGHYEFVWGKQLSSLVNSKILQLLNEFN